ncbi:MAG TPA: NnrS family protein, partial [Terracidiphilus sp.]|nr:NnrS family protein [Terracidiphilus sp.]
MSEQSVMREEIEILPISAPEEPRIRAERQSQTLIEAFLASGLFFMLLPGTFLGVWNLIGISRREALNALSPAWLQAHGQAQVFGWVGSFILGIGFYSLTKMQSTRTFPVGKGWTAWSLWTCGVALRWLGGVTGWHWRLLLPASGLLELGGFLLFFLVVSRHRQARGQSAMAAWMILVILSTVMLLLTLVVNAVALGRLAVTGSSPALPHLLDLQLVTMAIWGVLVPTIWGFNARWLPIFAGFEQPRTKWLFAGYLLSLAGIALVFLNQWGISSVVLVAAALLAVQGLGVWRPAIHPAKVLNIHPSFPHFLRIAYVWLVIASLLGCVAALEDRSGGIWGASRHALTVGFVALMVFTIGQRILPAFCGMRLLWSKELMLWSLVLLNAGCLLRVAMEPL